MTIVLVAPPKTPIPPKTYGGTQRDVYWLAKALSYKGHQVYVLASKGSYVNEQVKIIEVPPDTKGRDFEQYLPPDFDIVNYHVKINFTPDYPYLHSLHGNAKVEEWLPQNTSFISWKHAYNHGGRHYVYNGLDLDEYEFQPESQDYFSFIGKISWKRKNLRYVLKLAKKSGIRLKIAGGRRLTPNPKIQYLGMIGGTTKNDFLKNAKGLLFPTAWEEPMGIVVIESMACGTPAITSTRGAMPELVSKETGFVCDNENEYLNAIENISTINREICRERVWQYFSKEAMANGYLTLFDQILKSPNRALHSDLDINATLNEGNKVDIQLTTIEKFFESFKKAHH